MLRYLVDVMEKGYFELDSELIFLVVRVLG
jgi:hypothetical protein